MKVCKNGGTWFGVWFSMVGLKGNGLKTGLERKNGEVRFQEAGITRCAINVGL